MCLSKQLSLAKSQNFYTCKMNTKGVSIPMRIKWETWVEFSAHPLVIILLWSHFPGEQLVQASGILMAPFLKDCVPFRYCRIELRGKNRDQADFTQTSVPVQFSSVTQSCLTLCDPMDCSTPGFPVQHQLPELTQTHVHWVGDAIQSSHPLASPSPPAFNLSQHQGLFKWVSSLHQVAKGLEFQLQHQSFQWIIRTDFL